MTETTQLEREEWRKQCQYDPWMNDDAGRSIVDGSKANIKVGELRRLVNDAELMCGVKYSVNRILNILEATGQAGWTQTYVGKGYSKQGLINDLRNVANQLEQSSEQSNT